MVVGDVDVTLLHALGAHLFEEPGGGNLPFDHDAGRHLFGDVPGKAGEKVVLEDAAGALHGGRVFFVPNGEDSVRRGT